MCRHSAHVCTVCASLCVHACTHVCVRAHACVHNACLYIQVRGYTWAHRATCMHGACMHACTGCMRACMQCVQVCTCMHSVYVHMYKCVFTCTHSVYMHPWCVHVYMVYVHVQVSMCLHAQDPMEDLCFRGLVERLCKDGGSGLSALRFRRQGHTKGHTTGKVDRCEARAVVPSPLESLPSSLWCF